MERKEEGLFDKLVRDLCVIKIFWTKDFKVDIVGDEGKCLFKRIRFDY